MHIFGLLGNFRFGIWSETFACVCLQSKRRKEDISRGTITFEIIKLWLAVTICDWILIVAQLLIDCWSVSHPCRHFCRGHWMTIEAWDTIPNQVVWRFVWFKARMTFTIHKLHSKLKNSTKWVICGGAYLIIMLIWYNLALFIKRKCDFILSLSLSP